MSEAHKTAEERYIDVHEAAKLLEISEEELWHLAHDHKIPSHNLAGAFLRFKKEELEAVKIKWRIERELFPKPQQFFAHDANLEKETAVDKFKDFWYFNDFYVICSLVAVILLYFIVTSQ